MTLVGMTTAPEVFLAREAELCYTTMAHVTDYDVWHTSEEPVTVEMVVEILNKNTQVAQESLRNLVRLLPAERPCACSTALASALITRHSDIPADARERTALLTQKYLNKT
jgi:5'-methylthioadenosine phosphorylase